MGYKWSAAELERLSELLGDHPLPVVVRAYNSWAKQWCHHKRSYNGIRFAAQRILKTETRPSGLWLLTADVAALLSRSQFCVRKWIERGHIPAADVRKTGFAWYIRRSAFKQIAATRPALLGGVPREQLFQLLEDEDLAASIAMRFPKRISAPRTIRNKLTGVVYQSVQEAARETYIDHSAIIKALRNDRPCCGIDWEVVA